MSDVTKSTLNLRTINGKNGGSRKTKEEKTMAKSFGKKRCRARNGYPSGKKYPILNNFALRNNYPTRKNRLLLYRDWKATQSIVAPENMMNYLKEQRIGATYDVKEMLEKFNKHEGLWDKYVAVQIKKQVDSHKNKKKLKSLYTESQSSFDFETFMALNEMSDEIKTKEKKI